MIVYFFIVFGSLIFLTGSALLALRWAARTGQLRHFQKTALSIFDEEEPVGRMTDAFPGKGPTPMQTDPEPTLARPSATLAHPMGEGRGEGALEFMVSMQARWPQAASQESRSSGRQSAPSASAENQSRLTPPATKQP